MPGLEDMMPVFITDMAKKWCIRQDEQGKQPSYCWYFDRKLPGDENGAWHSSELWYFFGTLKNCWRPFEDMDYALSDQMTTALCNFAKTGSTIGGNMWAWNPTTARTKKVMLFGENPTAMGFPKKAKMWYTMLTNKAVGE